MNPQEKKVERLETTAKTAENNSLKAAKEAQEKLMKMGSDSMEQILREAGNLYRISRECSGVCAGVFSASVKSGSAASHMIWDVSKRITENINRAFSENTELLKEALTCHTFKDIAEWHEKFRQQTFNRYSEEASVLWETLFNGCGKAMEPLQTQTSVASGQLRKVMAA